MIPTKTHNFTVVYTAPKSWDPAQDGECGNLEVRQGFYAGSTRKIAECTSTWKPTVEELAMLNCGGVIEVCILTAQQPPLGLCVTRPVGEVYVNDVGRGKTITINEDNDYGA